MVLCWHAPPTVIGTPHLAWKLAQKLATHHHAEAPGGGQGAPELVVVQVQQGCCAGMYCLWQIDHSTRLGD